MSASPPGVAPLVRDVALDTVADDWSTTMMRADYLHHRPSLGDTVSFFVTNTWTRLGENVGYGHSVDQLHRMFMASAPHRANVLGDYNRLGIGAVIEPDGTIWVTFNFLKGPAINGPTGLGDAPVAAPATPPAGDILLAGADGAVFAYGNAPFAGSLAGEPLSAPVVGMANVRDGGGYWLVASDGGIFSFGGARFHGSTGGIRLNQPIVGMAATSSGNGYWLVARDGGIFAFGDAVFHGSTGGIRLNQPIVGMAATPSGNGYWLVAADGGIFAFGDAAFHGSTGAIALARPITGMAPTPSGNGYWLVAEDGGIFAFGDAAFHGSTGGQALSAMITRIIATSSGNGYRLVGRDGRVYSFGDAGNGASGPIWGANVVGVAVTS